ncbi:MAG: TetR/AcrR family transcriptional regulator [bacterium]
MAIKPSVTKDRLLESALKLISHKGYLGTTTREIARTAGVTELTLFRHFGSKERLFEELLGRHTFLPTLRELLPKLEPLSYEEALRTIATRFLMSLKELKPMVKIMHSEINLYPVKIRKVYNQFISETRGVLAGYFESLQSRGILREFSSALAAQAFFGMLFSYFRHEEIVKGIKIPKKKMERDVQQFADIFIRGTLRKGN